MCVQGRGGGVLLVRHVVLVLTKHVVCGAIQFPPTATVGDRLVRPFYSAQWHSARYTSLILFVICPFLQITNAPTKNFPQKERVSAVPESEKRRRAAWRIYLST